MTGKNAGGFDHIVSLGYNCEVSFRIEEYQEKSIDSYPLSWAYVLKQEHLPFVLENLEQICTAELELNEWGMYLCKALQLTLHTNVPHANLPDMTAQQRREFDEQAQKEIRSRFRHLCDKWRNLLNGGESTLFLLKLQSWNKDLNSLKKTAHWLRQNYRSGRFLLVVAVSDRTQAAEIAELLPDDSAVLCLSHFAEDNDTQNGGDREGWRRGISFFDHYFDSKSRFGWLRRARVLAPADRIFIA